MATIFCAGAAQAVTVAPIAMVAMMAKAAALGQMGALHLLPVNAEAKLIPGELAAP